METEKNITVITQVKPSESKGGLPTLKDLTSKEIIVSSEKLATNLKEFLEKFKPVIEQQATKVGSFEVSEIEIHIVINASGGIELIGKAEVGFEGGITIKLQKTNS